MAAPPPQTNGIITLFRPIILLSLSAYYIPITLFNLISTYQFNKLTSWSDFQDAWFGTFWSWFGPKSREIGDPVVAPLLTEAHGVVLDIGPGNGQWVNLFSPARNPNITKIFGVEPNYEHHASLRRRIAEVGLEDVYEILAVGAEKLDTCGIEKGSIDTICTIQCLCSVPGPETIIKELYPYLKSGGKWLVFEHVRTKYQNDFVGHWQSMYTSGVEFYDEGDVDSIDRMGGSYLAYLLWWMLDYTSY